MTSTDLLTAKDVARKLSVTTQTVYGYVTEGVLPVVRLVSGRLRFRGEDVEAFISANYAVTPDSPSVAS